MGNSGSRLADIPDDPERYFGLENFGNTCYCNSVLQALYFCKPFRLLTQRYAPPAGQTGEETLLTCLTELYNKVGSQKKRSGTVAPRRFIAKLRKDNELFRGYMHQDAHEFLNYLLNEIAETLLKEQAALKQRQAAGAKAVAPPEPAAAGDARAVAKSPDPSISSADANGSGAFRPPPTWVHEIFEGVLANETKCLCCETITNRDESFLDLSVDVEQNTSVTGCLRNFSSSEILCHKDKFFCDMCCSLQEAEKRMRIKRLPYVLALHLKRFKFVDNQYKKLSYRVAFPFELRLVNTSDDAEDTDRLYELFAVVIHIGSGPNQGHYITLVKSGTRWLIFDDDVVEELEERDMQSFFGSTSEAATTAESGYILFYQATTLNEHFLNLARSANGSNPVATAVAAALAAHAASPVPTAPADSEPTPGYRGTNVLPSHLNR